MSLCGPSPTQLLAHTVGALGFGWYTDEEIIKLSVKRITQSQVYDNLQQPIRGGLYDPAFGTIDKFQKSVYISAHRDRGETTVCAEKSGGGGGEIMGALMSSHLNTLSRCVYSACM